jgi:hypothetical protein
MGIDRLQICENAAARRDAPEGSAVRKAKNWVDIHLTKTLDAAVLDCYPSVRR